MDVNMKTNDPNFRAKEIILLDEELQQKTDLWKATWKDTLQYVHPNRNVVFPVSEGGKRGEYLFSSVATRSANEFAEHVQTLMTPQGSYFFGLTSGLEEVDMDDECWGWLQDTAERMHAVLHRSNFFIENSEASIDWDTVGTSCMSIEKDEDEVVRFETFPIWQLGVKENHNGIIDICTRRIEYTLENLVREFGKENLPADVVREFDSAENSGRSTKKYTVIHCIRPRGLNNSNGKIGPKYRKFESIKVLKEKQHILNETGYNTFPIAINRFRKMSDETLGRSPAMDGLPDVKSLNAMKKAELQGMQLTVAPSFQVRDNSLVNPLQFKPFGINYTRGDAEIKPLVQGGVRIDLGLEVVKYLGEEVEKCFYLDKLRVAERDRMTATEIIQRRDENFRGLGSILSRYQREHLKIVVDRVFDIMYYQNMFKQIPVKLLQGTKGKIGIKYNSMLDRAQKTGNTEGLTRAISAAAPFLQNRPDAWDNFNVDVILRKTMKNFDVDNEFLVPQEMVMEIRNQRQQMAELQKQQMQAQTMTESAKGMNEFMKGAGQ
jgi:hypothetical protein